MIHKYTGQTAARHVKPLRCFPSLNIGSKLRLCTAGNGYMPCNGYVPCQPEQLRPDLLAERMEGAMPCHNYKGGDMVWTLTMCGYNVLRARRDSAGLLVRAGVLVWTIWRHLLNLPRLWSFYSDQAAAVQLYLLYAEFLVFSRVGFLNFYIGHGPNLRCRQLVKMSGYSNKTFFGKRGSYHRSKIQQI